MMIITIIKRTFRKARDIYNYADLIPDSVPSDSLLKSMLVEISAFKDLVITATSVINRI